MIFDKVFETDRIETTGICDYFDFLLEDLREEGGKDVAQEFADIATCLGSYLSAFTCYAGSSG